MMTEKSNSMLTMKYVEFYITNVCNYSCTNCRSLNNYKFSGHQKWKDYSGEYIKWSKLLEIDSISILGGEPTLNPTFREWCIGVRELWPNAKIKLVTNGSTLDTTFSDFYDFCSEYQIILDATAHGRHSFLPLYNKIREVMQGNITQIITNDGGQWADAYKQVKGDDWPECDSINQFENLPEHIRKECADIHKIDPENYLFNSASSIQLNDANGFAATMNYGEDFVTAPVKYIGDNKFTVYNSDPVKAHDVCIMQNCHHFVKGKLYKCHNVALLPEFLQQYNVEISDEDIDLLHQYKPGTPNLSNNELEEFLKNLPNPIDQCKLCPSSLDTYSVIGDRPKEKIKKIPIVIDKNPN
jgi:organic radical activating enzyme